MNRCARFACVPHVDVGVLTITRSPSIMGETVRPPCVVNGDKFFGDGALPQLLAVFGKSRHHVIHAEAIDVAGFGIGNGRSPALRGAPARRFETR